MDLRGRYIRAGGSTQNIQLLHEFFARAELLALAGRDSLVLAGRKRKRRENQVVLGSCANFVLPARPSSPLSNIFYSCSVEIGFLSFLGSSTSAMLAVFLKSFASVKAVSEITENGLFNGSERRKRSMAAPRWISLMNFCKLRVCHLYSSQTGKASLEKQSVMPSDIYCINFPIR